MMHGQIDWNLLSRESIDRLPMHQFSKAQGLTAWCRIANHSLGAGTTRAAH
jgi:hypothetical protein